MNFTNLNIVTEFEAGILYAHFNRSVRSSKFCFSSLTQSVLTAFGRFSHNSRISIRQFLSNTQQDSSQPAFCKLLVSNCLQYVRLIGEKRRIFARDRCRSEPESFKLKCFSGFVHSKNGAHQAVIVHLFKRTIQHFFSGKYCVCAIRFFFSSRCLILTISIQPSMFVSE